jgi:hypothetical protein
MPEVILRTKDGWEKKMAIPEHVALSGDFAIAATRDLDLAFGEDARVSTYRVKHFRPSGEVIQIWEEW